MTRHPFPAREDLGYFDRVSFAPRADSIVDRWFQVPDGRSVDEIEFLIRQCRDRYGLDDLGLLADPLAGAGSAAVAAATAGLGFVGLERDAPRALFALAKCVSLACSAIDLREIEDLAAAASALRSDTRVDPFAYPALVLACAVAVARLAGSDLSSGNDPLPAINRDLGALGQAGHFRRPLRPAEMICADANTSDLPTFADWVLPTAIITSPPHPRTRATWAADDSEAAALARRSLERFGRWAHRRGGVSTQSTPVHGVFRVAQRLPATRIVILECESPVETDPVEREYVAIGEESGFAVEEYVTTYLSAPDQPGRGRGGYLVFRPITYG